MDLCYQNAFRLISPYKSEIEALIKSKDGAALQKLLYKIMTVDAYPEYRSSLGPMSRAIWMWANYFQVQVQWRPVLIFYRNSMEDIQRELTEYKVYGAYYHVQANVDLGIKINRRIVINTKSQKAAEVIISNLVANNGKVRSFLKKYKIFLAQVKFAQIKDDKIVLYYACSHVKEGPGDFDENGKSILSLVGEVEESSSKFFPFYYVLGPGIAFGDEPLVLTYQSSAMSFSDLRCLAMSQGLIAYTKFPDTWEDLKALLNEPFTKVKVNPEQPWLNL